MQTSLFIPTAEAAFIAGLTDRQMNRVVDELLVPESLFAQRGSSRLFTRLGAAFAKFYFSTEDQLLAGVRRQILDELNVRVERLAAKDQVLALRLLDSVSWRVEHNHVEVDVLPFLHEALSRAKEVEQADALITTDPEVMGGAPVFAGTRVPLAIVLGSLAAGIQLDRLKGSYPFLTEAHIRAAKVYEEVHPRRGRPRRFADVNPEVSRRVTRVLVQDDFTLMPNNSIDFRGGGTGTPTPRFHLKQANSRQRNWMPMNFRSCAERDSPAPLSDPLITSVLGETIDYGKLFAYLFRRFGYPEQGWDRFKHLVTYYLTTPHPDMLMVVTPSVGGASSIAIRFLVEADTFYAIEAYGQRDRNAWDARSLDWAQEQGLPDWMQEWVQIYNTDYREAFSHLPVATDWRQTVGIYYAIGEEGAPEYEMTHRVAQFRQKLREEYQKVEPYPAFYYRPQDLTQCRDDDPLKPFVGAARDALKDLLTPVGVRDQAINALGQVGVAGPSRNFAQSAGYPSGALGNAAPEEFAQLHELVLKLGEGDIQRGIQELMAAVAVPSE